jgi:hypothetical protein
VIERHIGHKLHYRDNDLKSITTRHIANVVTGASNITVSTLEAVADEIGADMIEFFEE